MNVESCDDSLNEGRERRKSESFFQRHFSKLMISQEGGTRCDEDEIPDDDDSVRNHWKMPLGVFS